MVVASLAGLVIRYRRGDAELRHQVRWLAFAAFGAAASIVLNFVAVVACGCDVRRAMVASQVVLSFVLPMPMIALLILSARNDVMGRYAMRMPLRIVAGTATVVIVGLNAYLVWAAFS